MADFMMGLRKRSTQWPAPEVTRLTNQVANVWIRGTHLLVDVYWDKEAGEVSVSIHNHRTGVLVASWRVNLDEEEAKAGLAADPEERRD